jgi:hypothetical protein
MGRSPAGEDGQGPPPANTTPCSASSTGGTDDRQADHRMAPASTGPLTQPSPASPRPRGARRRLSRGGRTPLTAVARPSPAGRLPASHPDACQIPAALDSPGRRVDAAVASAGSAPAQPSAAGHVDGDGALRSRPSSQRGGARPCSRSPGRCRGQVRRGDSCRRPGSCANARPANPVLHRPGLMVDVEQHSQRPATVLVAAPAGWRHDGPLPRPPAVQPCQTMQSRARVGPAAPTDRRAA